MRNKAIGQHAAQLSELYSPAFYEGQSPASHLAGRVVLPRVLELTAAASLVDVGCGVGTWVAAGRELGVPRVLGVDGPHVQRTSLLVPQECFRSVDLSLRGATSGLGRFDLAISLEVAEHLPRERASSFVAELVQLAPAVLFSAAIPYQGGTDHINEQWPSWWAELFRRARLPARRPSVRILGGARHPQLVPPEHAPLRCRLPPSIRTRGRPRRRRSPPRPLSVAPRATAAAVPARPGSSVPLGGANGSREARTSSWPAADRRVTGSRA